MSTTDYIPGQVYEVDPATLTIGTNVRTDAAEREEFAQSIKAVGVLEPITAYAGEDGALVVYRGQRRTLTATKVGTPTGTVPVRVVQRPEDAERIVAQMSENVHRAAMREAEERDAIEQLALLGVSAAQIAKRTAIRREQVDAALTVAKSQTAKERMDSSGLTLTQAAALAEFEDDPEAVATLEREIGWGRDVEHVAQRLRDDRAEREELRAEAERLRGEGIPALDPEHRPDSLWKYDLRNLVRASDGQPVPQAEWADLTGAAVVLEKQWTEAEDQDDEDHPEDQDAEDRDDEDEGWDEAGQEVEVIVQVWVCLDPEAAGLCGRFDYRRPAQPSTTGDQSEHHDPEQAAAAAEAEAEAKRVERRRVIENNKAWRSAETVRREWLAGFVTRKTAPKGAEAFICAAVVEGPHWLGSALDDRHAFLRGLLTGQEVRPAYTDEGRQQIEALHTTQGTTKAQTMRTLAAIVAAWEAHTDVHTWRGPDQWDRRVMAALTDWGYKPSEVEQLLLAEQDQDDEDAA